MPKRSDEDLVRVHDMLEAAQKVSDLVARKSRASLDENEVLQLALRYLVLIIGEAAYHVSHELRARYPKTPWALIIGMRHHLVHGYSAVDLNILWVAVSENVPQLISDLENILHEEFGIIIEPFSLALHLEAICAYCETQPIERLSEFAPGFEGWIRPDTDMGLLVDYIPGASVTLLDMAGHENDLGEIIGKRVCLFTTKGLRQSPYSVPFDIGRRLYEKKT